MAVFSTVRADLAHRRGRRRLGANTSSLIGSLGPVFTIGLGAMILGEAVHWIQLAGAALVLAGVMLVTLRPGGDPRPAVEAAAETRLVSSIVLPHVVDHLAVVGSSPGAWNATSPRSLVMSRIDATIASALDDRLRRDLDVQRHPVAAFGGVDDEPRLADLGMAGDDRGDLRRVDEQAFHLRRLIGAAHPTLDAQVRAAARARAGQAPPKDRRCRNGSADSRCSKSVVTTTSPTSPGATGSPVPGRTISTSTPSSTTSPARASVS